MNYYAFVFENWTPITEPVVCQEFEILCKVCVDGQHTLTLLIYPNKPSLSPPHLPGVITQVLPCPPPHPTPPPLPTTFNTTQPAAFSAFTEATQDTHSHTHVIKSQAGYGRGNSMSGKEVQKPVRTQNSAPYCWALRALEENFVEPFFGY